MNFKKSFNILKSRSLTLQILVKFLNTGYEILRNSFTIFGTYEFRRIFSNCRFHNSCAAMIHPALFFFDDDTTRFRRNINEIVKPMSRRKNVVTCPSQLGLPRQQAMLLLVCSLVKAWSRLSVSRTNHVSSRTCQLQARDIKVYYSRTAKAAPPLRLIACASQLRSFRGLLSVDKCQTVIDLSRAASGILLTVLLSLRPESEDRSELTEIREWGPFWTHWDPGVRTVLHSLGAGVRTVLNSLRTGSEDRSALTRSGEWSDETAVLSGVVGCFHRLSARAYHRTAHGYW